MTMDNLLKKRVTEVVDIFSKKDSWPIDDIMSLSTKVAENFKYNRKVAFLGNGGSAAEAIHLAAEFTGKCVKSHDPWPAICLNESQSAITAIANDFGYEFVFSRQVEAHLSRGDIMIALSTSGTSQNILRAITCGLDLGVECYLWSGRGAPHLKGVDIWRVPSTSTPRIQEIHLVWGHLLAEQVEDLLA